MDSPSTLLLHRLARNYLLCLADFPANLRPEHLPVEESEATRTFDPATREMVAFAASRYPKYRPYIRVPRLCNRGWLADFSATGKDYGAMSSGSLRRIDPSQKTGEGSVPPSGGKGLRFAERNEGWAF